MPVGCMQRPITLPSKHIESSEQRGGAVALVIMSYGASPACLHGQARLGAVEGLDLALFVDREHDGTGGRIDIKPDHIAQFVDELGIGGELELPHPVRLSRREDGGGRWAKR